MATRQEYDPLSAIPQPGIVREKLRDTERKAERLRILLRVSEEIHQETNADDAKVSGLAAVRINDGSMTEAVRKKGN
jgi:hypothetical protein